MRRGMISAPPFMPPLGMGFAGGPPPMPPLPQGMPSMPNMPQQQAPQGQQPLPQQPMMSPQMSPQMPAGTPPMFGQQMQPAPMGFPPSPFDPQVLMAFQQAMAGQAGAFNPYMIPMLAPEVSGTAAAAPAPQAEPDQPSVGLKSFREQTYITRGPGMQYSTRG